MRDTLSIRAQGFLCWASGWSRSVKGHLGAAEWHKSQDAAFQLPKSLIENSNRAEARLIERLQSVTFPRTASLRGVMMSPLIHEREKNPLSPVEICLIFLDQVKLRLVFQDLWLDPNDPCWRRSSSTSDVMHGRSNLQPPVLMEVGCVCVFLEISWSQSSLPPLLSSVLPLSHQGENYHGPIDLWGIPLWPQAAGVQCCDTGSPGSGGRVHPAHTCLSTAALYIYKKKCIQCFPVWIIQQLSWGELYASCSEYFSLKLTVQTFLFVGRFLALHWIQVGSSLDFKMML